MNKNSSFIFPKYLESPQDLCIFVQRNMDDKTTTTVEPRKLKRSTPSPRDLRAWITAECQRLGITEDSLKNLALRAVMESGMSVQLITTVDTEQVN